MIIICKECGKKCSSYVSLGHHLRRSDNHIYNSLEKYILHYFYDDKRPKCKCGCGKETNFHNHDFLSFARGCSPKVVNRTKEFREKESKSHLGINKGNKACSWSNHPELDRESIKTKTSKTLKDGYKTGKYTHWSKKNESEVKEIKKRICEHSQENSFISCKKGYYYSHKNEKKIYYQSSWELEKFIELDNDQLVKSWLKNEVIIKYFNSQKNKNCHFIVDFLVEKTNGEKCLLEIKGIIDKNALDKAESLFEYARKNNLTPSFQTKKERNGSFVDLTVKDIKERLKEK
jgi:hypothetical protein